MAAKKCPKCKELNGELSTRCWNCGLRIDGSGRGRMPAFLGTFLGVAVFAGILSCAGLFVLRVKKETSVVATSNKVFDLEATKTIALLETAHGAAQLDGNLRNFQADVHDVKVAVKQYNKTHNRKTEICEDFYKLLLSDEIILGLWQRQLQTHRAGLSSNIPEEKRVMDRILAKMPETKAVVVKDANGYTLPFNEAAVALWTRATVLLKETRRLSDLPADPNILQEEGTSTFNRRAASPQAGSSASNAVTQAYVATSQPDSLPTPTDEAPDGSDNEGAPVQPESDSAGVLQALKAADASTDQSLTAFSSQLKTAQKAVEQYVLRHGQEDATASKFLHIIEIESNIQSIWQQKETSGGQSLQVSSSSEKEALNGLLNLAPDLRTSVTARSRPGETPVYTISYDSIIQGLRAKAESELSAVDQTPS